MRKRIGRQVRDGERETGMEEVRKDTKRWNKGDLHRNRKKGRKS